MLIESLNIGDVDHDSYPEVCAGTDIVHILQWDGITYVEEAVIDQTYGDLAVNALVEIDDDIIQYLEVIFQKTDQDPQTQLRIIRVYEKIKSERAKVVLWNNIDYPDKKIVSQILLALANSGFIWSL